MAHFRKKSKFHSFCLLLALGAACFATAPILWAQTRTTRTRPARPIVTQPTSAAPSEEQPRYKAIWEPVNYPQDLELTGVFFVSADVGWVSGAAGTILHTTDGGVTWTPQLGGDPQSKAGRIGSLHFIDETHGWAQRAGELFRTTDGETWETVGSMSHYTSDYTFISATTGVYVAGDKIFRTQDGGRSWNEVYTCRTKVEVEGLMHDVGCSFHSLHFPSPTVGYAVSAHVAPNAWAVAKTEDGGATWAVSVVPEVEGDAVGVFFTDENTGVIITTYGNRKIYRTTDGGKTWRGVVGQWQGGQLQFVDPEVGWFCQGRNPLNYTTDGGKRWTPREFHFPAGVNGLSLPRRERAYVVGDHGMIYRYRVVPLDYNIAGMLDAPLMPGYDLGIQPDIQRLKNRIQALRARLEQAAQGGTSGTGQNPQSENAESETATQGGDSSTGGGFTQDTLVGEGFTQSTSESSGSTQSAGVSGGTQGTGDVGNAPAQDAGSSGFTQQTGEAAPASNFVQSCCAAQVQGVQASMGLVTQDFSAVSTKFRGLNMILSGMRLFSQLVGKTQAMRSSFVALKGAKNAQSALAALSQFSASLEDMTRTAATGFQSQPAFRQ